MWAEQESLRVFRLPHCGARDHENPGQDFNVPGRDQKAYLEGKSGKIFGLRVDLQHNCLRHGQVRLP